LVPLLLPLVLLCMPGSMRRPDQIDPMPGGTLETTVQQSSPDVEAPDLLLAPVEKGSGGTSEALFKD